MSAHFDLFEPKDTDPTEPRGVLMLVDYPPPPMGSGPVARPANVHARPTRRGAVRAFTVARDVLERMGVSHGA